MNNNKNRTFFFCVFQFLIRVFVLDDLSKI